MDDAKQAARFIGGMQTYLRYGAAHMREIGKRGGRPKKDCRKPGAVPSESNERRYLFETTAKGMTPREFMTRWHKSSHPA